MAKHACGIPHDSGHPVSTVRAPLTDRLKFCRNTLLAIALTFAFAHVPVEAQAGALDWLQGKQGKSKASVPNSSTATKKPATDATPMPSFFASPDSVSSEGSINLLKFTESHWAHARKVLEAVTRTLVGKIQAKRCTDISTKLFQIVSGLSKESLKNSAGAVVRLSQGIQTLDQNLVELGRIITAPREETLSNLDSVIQKAQNSTDAELRLAKAHLAGSENLITLGSEAYQTLELIPSLGITALDNYILGTKQLMRQIQSNGEAMKGLLLNVQSSCEQVSAGLEVMIATVKSTLRFSDHFAYRQYALINLPVPTREKLFSQLGMLKNSLKGIANTLEIGDSQVKNSTQQFSHLVEEMTAKIRDNLQYQTAADAANSNLPQISTYAQNQVLGLFQRAKEGVAQMKVAMAKEGRERISNSAPPQIALESSEESTVRTTSKVASEKLPLFLLGVKGPSLPAMTAKTLSSPPSADEERGKTMILYSEKATPAPDRTASRNPIWRSDEMDILQKELGSDLPYIETALQSSAPSRSADQDPLSFEGGQAKEESEILKDGGNQPRETLGRMNYPESESVGDSDGSLATSRLLKSGPNETSQDLEFLNLDNSQAADNEGQLLPMLRLDDSTISHPKGE